MTDSLPTIGFMGLGIMGRPMARNILDAGYRLLVYNRTRSKAEGIAEAGASVCETPAELAREADVILCMVTGPEAVEALLFGENGAAGNLGPGKIVVNMSSVSPMANRDLAARLAESGAEFADAPVSGSRKPAEEGKLVILAGGRDETIDTLEPLLLTMGSRVVRCGEAGAGAQMKMSINLLLGAMMEGFAEMIAFGEAGGLSREAMLDVVMSGPLANGLFQLKEPMFRDDGYPTQFPLKHMAKDLKFAVDTAHVTGAQAPSAHATLQVFRRAAVLGHGDEDFAAVIRALES